MATEIFGLSRLTQRRTHYTSQNKFCGDPRFAQLCTGNVNAGERAFLMHSYNASARCSWGRAATLIVFRKESRRKTLFPSTRKLFLLNALKCRRQIGLAHERISECFFLCDWAIVIGKQERKLDV